MNHNYMVVVVAVVVVGWGTLRFILVAVTITIIIHTLVCDLINYFAPDTYRRIILKRSRNLVGSSRVGGLVRLPIILFGSHRIENQTKCILFKYAWLVMRIGLGWFDHEILYLVVIFVRRIVNCVSMILFCRTIVRRSIRIESFRRLFRFNIYSIKYGWLRIPNIRKPSAEARLCRYWNSNNNRDCIIFNSSGGRIDPNKIYSESTPLCRKLLFANCHVLRRQRNAGIWPSHCRPSNEQRGKWLRP